MEADKQQILPPEGQPLGTASISSSPSSQILPSQIPQLLGGLPVLELSGSPQEMGAIHGRRFREEIALCAEAYGRVWSQLSPKQISSFVASQRKLIETHFPRFAEEICALAAAAGIPEERAFALNGRTEITLHQHTLEALRGHNSSPVPECTLLGSTATKVMGENWDWAECIEKITILNHITLPEGLRILTLTEPGIIGKVGMNSAGIGVGLNFIPGTSRNSGLPVHMLLRACLEATSFEQISDMMDEFARKDLLGTMSAITVMDRHGNAEMFEILGPELVRAREMHKTTFVHTNHPVLNPEGYGTTDLENTLCRLFDARELADRGPLTVDALIGILADRSDPVHSINMRPQDWGAIGAVETIRSLVFDLEQGNFLISKGAPGASSDPVAYDSFKLY